MRADPARGCGVETQWGHVSGNGGSLDTFVSRILMPLAAGRADVGFSVGTLKPSCDVGECGEFVGASSVVEGRVLQSQAGGSTSGVGLTVGAQKVFIDGGKLVSGAGLTWTKR